MFSHLLKLVRLDSTVVDLCATLFEPSSGTPRGGEAPLPPPV